MNTVSRLLFVPLSVALLTTVPLLQAATANSTKVSVPKTVAQTPASPSQTASIDVAGTIRFVDVEGGCYQLQASNGRTFELLGQFPRQDGLQVQVRGKLLKDTATTCQVGQPLQVESVRVIQPGSQPQPQRALEVSIFGIGPAVDAQAVEAVRSVIGRAVAEGVIDTYITYGYGIEGGTSSCIQLSRFQDPKQLLPLKNQLLQIKPNPQTTSYTVKAVAECTQPSQSTDQLGDQLAGSEWVLKNLEGTGAIASPQKPTLRFTSTDRIEGQGGCNSYSAQSKLDGNNLTVSNLIATKRACVDARVQQQENRYFRALERAKQLILEGDLFIYGEGAEKPLVFSRLKSSSQP